MNKIYFCLAVLFCLIITADVLGQQIAKPIDPIPLEKPEYFSIISINKDNPDKIFEIISDTLRKFGYTIVSIRIRDQKIDAEKYDTEDNRNYCKVLIWLERDFQEPDKFIKVFFFYGRYEYMIAKTSESFRVVLTKPMQEKYFGKLKESLASISKLN